MMFSDLNRLFELLNSRYGCKIWKVLCFTKFHSLTLWIYILVASLLIMEYTYQRNKTIFLQLKFHKSWKQYSHFVHLENKMPYADLCYDKYEEVMREQNYVVNMRRRWGNGIMLFFEIWRCKLILSFFFLRFAQVNMRRLPYDLTHHISKIYVEVEEGRIVQ
jgi:hypothetical protein